MSEVQDGHGLGLVVCPDCGSDHVSAVHLSARRWQFKLDGKWHLIDPPSYVCDGCDAFIFRIHGIWCVLDAVPF